LASPAVEKLLGKRKRPEEEAFSVLENPYFYKQFKAELQDTEAWTRQLPTKEERQTVIGILKLQRENLEILFDSRKKEKEAENKERLAKIVYTLSLGKCRDNVMGGEEIDWTDCYWLFSSSYSRLR